MTMDLPRVDDSLSLLIDAVNLGGQKILDVGCGDGGNMRRLQQFGADVVGVEPNPRGDQTGLTILKSTAEMLPFEASSFDGVCYFYSIHHVPMECIEQALVETHRVMKAGGFLYIIDPRSNGSCFDLTKDIDDETGVQKKAFDAVTRALNSELFKKLWQKDIMEVYDYEDYPTYRAEMVGVNEERARLFANLDVSQKTLFDTLGEVCEKGRRFTQQSHVMMLQKR